LLKNTAAVGVVATTTHLLPSMSMILSISVIRYDPIPLCWYSGRVAKATTQCAAVAVSTDSAEQCVGNTHIHIPIVISHQQSFKCLRIHFLYCTVRFDNCINRRGRMCSPACVRACVRACNRVNLCSFYVLTLWLLDIRSSLRSNFISDKIFRLLTW
jgi:hypothetical protein